MLPRLVFLCWQAKSGMASCQTLGRSLNPGKGFPSWSALRGALGQVIEVLGTFGREDTQILGAVKRGPTGIRAINVAPLIISVQAGPVSFLR